MSLRVRLLISFMCALAVGGLFVAYGKQVRAHEAELRSDALERFGGETAQVVVAQNVLSAGKEVTPDDVEVKEWLVELAPQGVFTNSDEVVGKVITNPVDKGAPVSELAFEDKTTVLEVPLGKVAIALPVSESLGLVPGIDRGTRLALYLVDKESATLITDDVEVLSLPADSKSYVANAVVTIALDPRFVSEVLSASTKAGLKLVLPGGDVGELDAAPQAVLEPQDSNEGELDG